VGEDEGAVGEGLSVLRSGLAPGSVADVGDEKVRVSTAGLGDKFPVLVSGDRVLLHHGLRTNVVGEAGPVGVPVRLLEHGIGGTQEPKLGGGGFCGEHAEEATHMYTIWRDLTDTKLRSSTNPRQASEVLQLSLHEEMVMWAPR
jgi:hypothetical protein